MQLAVRFIDPFDTVSVLPESSLTINLTVDPEDTAAENDAKQLAEKRFQGCMALLRTMHLMQAIMGEALFATMATDARDAYLAEFGDSLEDDLFSPFQDAP